MSFVEKCWDLIKNHFEWIIAIEGAIFTTIVLKSAGTIPAACIFVFHLVMVMLFFASVGEVAAGGGAGTMTRPHPRGSLIPAVANSTSITTLNSNRSSRTWF